MPKTYTLVLTKEETLFVAASMYLAVATLKGNKEGTLGALADLFSIDEEVKDSTATKLENAVFLDS
jgi:hypothetical protein